MCACIPGISKNWTGFFSVEQTISWYRVPQKKCPTTCVHSLVSVTYQLLQKNQFDVQAQGLVVVHAKDG